MLKCRDISQLLYDYVEGILDPPIHQQLEQHLADCPGCIAFVNTYRQTITLSKELREEEIPQELQQKLQSFIKEKLHKPGFWSRLRTHLTG